MVSPKPVEEQQQAGKRCKRRESDLYTDATNVGVRFTDILTAHFQGKCLQAKNLSDNEGSQGDLKGGVRDWQRKNTEKATRTVRKRSPLTPAARLRLVVVSDRGDF